MESQGKSLARTSALSRHLCRIGLVALLAAPAGAQTIIDEFSSVGANTAEPPGVSRNTVGSTTAVDSGLTNVIGGTRSLTTVATSIAGGSPEVSAGVMAMAQSLVYSSTVLANGRVELRYDANGAGLNANLAPGDGIQFDIVTDASAVPCDVTITLSDGVNTQSSTQNIAVSGLASLQFFYSSFPMVDLSTVFSIVVVIDPNQAGDLEAISPIITFGEPICGNAVIDDLEECDDGNAFSGDGCEPDCTISAACTFVHPLGTERFVGACGAPSFGSIQAAVTASSSGDIVSICPGAYNEAVAVTQEVTIRSTGGPGVTSVTSAGITFDIRRSGVIIEGLTISGTTAAVQADAICGLGISSCTLPSRGSSVAITGNVIQNSALGVGWQRKIDCAAITNNSMSNNAAGIDLNQQENPPALFVAVQGNTILGGGSSGQSVRLQNLGSPLIFAQNTIDGSAAAGVVLADLVPGTQMLENNVRNSATDGVIVKPGAGGVRILQNNIEDNGGLGLANEAPEETLDATLNWWGSQTGPFKAVEFPTGTGDEIQERAGGLDTLFIEFLCAPAPAGFPSVLGVCDTDGGGSEIDFIALGRDPDISPNGRYISFVSDRDLNGDARLSIDNSDLGDEVFILNRKPNGKPASVCIGGLNPGAGCTKPSQCKGNLNLDPIVTDGDCVLFTQISHDAGGANDAFTPRVTKRGDVFSTHTADLIGANPDGSREVLKWLARDFRRMSPNDPNVVIDAVSSSPVDSEAPGASRNGRFVIIESLADFTGNNPDGNRELFARDTLKNTWSQITNTLPPVENKRPSTHNGKQVLFDSTADLVPGSNPDGNRELFFGELRGTTWSFIQITNTVAPVENRAGQVARKGRILAFSSNGNFTGNNADGNFEIFVQDSGVFEQITVSTAGENVNVHANPKGRFVTFESTTNLEGAANLVINRRVFLFDRNLNRLIIVSRSFFGNNFVPRLSNGRFIVWESTANLTGQNPTAQRVIYAFDRRRDD